MQATADIHIVDAGTKASRNSMSLMLRKLAASMASNPTARTKQETPNSRRAINTLKTLCSALPVSSGSPFRIIRMYATFVPRKNPAASALTRDRAASAGRRTKITK